MRMQIFLHTIFSYLRYKIEISLFVHFFFNSVCGTSKAYTIAKFLSLIAFPRNRNFAKILVNRLNFSLIDLRVPAHYLLPHFFRHFHRF